jgi:transcription elongation GreA/GreB family factor
VSTSKQHRPSTHEAAGVVRIGSRVRIRDADGDAEFSVVEPEDADAVAERVSASSPLGRALLGRHVGDEVRFRAPGGVLAVTVVNVS